VLTPFLAGFILAGAAKAQLPVGITASWSNAASGNPGTIRLAKKLAQNNQKCEEVEYFVRSGGTPTYSEHYHFTSCLQPDGTWKLA
jgi:surface antigen